VSGLNVKRLVWTIIFLGITLVAIVMEVVAGVFHPAGTIPWTEYIARYVPWPVQLVAYVTLAVWLPFHFWRHDHLRKVAYRQGYQAAQRDAIVRRGRVPGEPVHRILSEPHQDLL
jgi:hypothetical protein